MTSRDKLHFTFNTIDGYNKPFNFVISEREAGKSTAMILDKLFKNFKDGNTSLVFRRLISDITDIYINDIAEIINKFNDEQVRFIYKKGSIKDGIVDVKCEYKGETRLFMRIVGLSNPISRIKSLFLKNIRCIVFDEFICNPKFDNERYLKNESFKFKEIFNTFQREYPQLKCYFLGNPYSLYNPYFVDLNVDTSKLKRGAIISGTNYVIQCYQICNELRDMILQRNPLYQFDDSYKKYAFDGLAINDANIPIRRQLPNNYSLKYAFRIDGKYLVVYRNNDYTDAMQFYIMIDKNVSKKRKVFCFDFDDLISHVVMLSVQERTSFNTLKRAIREQSVEYSNEECYYLTEEIYSNI